MYVLSVQYSCAVVSVFLFGGKANLVLLTLFYSTLLALTYRQKDRESNTLASCGLEKPFFISSCAVVSVFCSGGKQVVVLHTTYVLRSTIKLWCGVQFFWFWRKIVFCVLYIWYYLLYNTVVRLCRFLVLVGNWFWFYILMYLEYNTIVVLCQFFGPGGKQLLTLCTYLLYKTVVGLCQFFGCGGKQFSK